MKSAYQLLLYTDNQVVRNFYSSVFFFTYNFFETTKMTKELDLQRKVLDYKTKVEKSLKPLI